MNLTYDSHVIKLASVDWKSDHHRVAHALTAARGKRVIVRAHQPATGKREITPAAAPDLDRALSSVGIDPAQSFDLEIVIRQPGPDSPVRQALHGDHGYRDPRDFDQLQWAGERGTGTDTRDAAHYHPLRPVPMFLRENGAAVDLVDTHRGGSVFLILNGPSFATLDHHALRQPGILTFGVNNGGHGFRPHYWTCVDDPTRFMASIWRDPAITKFVPLAHYQKPIWDADHDRISAEKVKDFPRVFGFRRNEQFRAEQWLTEDTINWGNHGERGGGRSVMLSALRICHLLGFRRVFLLGCDFHMDTTHSYWFPEHRSDQAIRNNTDSYHLMRGYFAALRPHFDAADFQVLNCTEGSRLGPEIFPHYPLDQAIAECALDTSPSTHGHYVDRYQKKKPTTPPASPHSIPLSPPSILDPHSPILAPLVAAIGSAPVHADPFFHLTFPSVFPPDVYARLHDHLPPASAYEDLRHRDAMQADGSSARLHLVLTPDSLATLPPAIREFWTPIHEALASPQVKTALFARHYPALFRRFGREGLRTLKVEPRLSLIRDLAGYRIGVHKDIEQKVITTQFYLPRDESQAHLGTAFYRRTQPKTEELKTEKPSTDEPFQLAKRLPFLPNSGYSFTVAPDSFHGVDPLAEQDAPRDSLMLVYYLIK